MNDGTQRGSSLAVVGAGWAGLAASVRAREAGMSVTLYEMSASAGGRARTVFGQGVARDNGQHILIGAYVRTLALMRTVGVIPEQVLARAPLALVDASGRGLRLPPGAALPSFVRAVLAHPAWSWRDRVSLLLHALRWAVGGFAVDPDRPVAAWCASLPPAARRDLIEPLCVAALNTPAAQASTSVFLRVLRDAMFAERGSADLLLPKAGLSELLPQPAIAWLQQQGAEICLGHRVQAIARQDRAWALDDRQFDRVVLACSAREAARLARHVDSAWADAAAGFAYEPIVTAWLEAPRVDAPFPMISLHGEPAQFAFDLGQLDARWAGCVTLVISGAGRWVGVEPQTLRAALQRQVDRELAAVLPAGYRIVSTATEKRATFRCTPALVRPRQLIAPGLLAAGDFVEGPYPATLEGAVRSAEAAIALLRSPPG